MAAFSAGRPKESNPNGDRTALALHGLVADRQVTEGVVAHVALVRRPRRVGVHAQRVELLPGVVVVDLVGALVVPVALPLPLHRIDVVRACHRTRVGDTLVRLSRPSRCRRALGRPIRGSPAPGTRRGGFSSTAIVDLHHWGRSSAGRAPDWQSGGSWVQVPSPPPTITVLSPAWALCHRTYSPRLSLEGRRRSTLQRTADQAILRQANWIAPGR